MDLDLAIRPWLVACGSHWGANEAFAYRNADEHARIRRPHFTYKQTRFIPADDGVANISTLPNPSLYDVNVTAVELWIATIEVKLFHHKDAMEGLGWCCVAAKKDPDVSSALGSKNAAFKRCLGVDDDTEYDADDFYYEHTMECTFYTWAMFLHNKTNHRIETVDTDDMFTID